MAAYKLVKMGKEVTVFKAQWERYGKKAGFIRNTEMARWADIAVVLWDGKSRGTEHMVSEMRRLKKKVFTRRVAATVPARQYRSRQWCYGHQDTSDHQAPPKEAPKPQPLTSVPNLTLTCWCGYCTKIAVKGNASCIWCQQKVDVLSQYEQDREWLRHRACQQVMELGQDPDPGHMGWPEDPGNDLTQLWLHFD